jgi:hypothetical protein
MFFNNEQNTFQYIIEKLIKTNYLTELLVLTVAQILLI